MNYIEKLNEIMKISGWSRARLSDLLNVNYSTFSRWLDGETEPTEEHARLIDKLYLMVTVDFEVAKREYFEGLEKRLLRRQVRKLDENNPVRRNF